jgi:hypothetical protein
MTPCSRVENLSKIKPTIPYQCTWVVFFDKKVGNVDDCIGDICIHSENTGFYGNPLRNEFLDMFQDKFTDEDWVYILDDDNIIHPEWYSTISTLVENNDKEINFINWGQVDSLPPTKNPKIGNIDTASFMYKPNYFRNIRYSMEYTSDGKIAAEIYKVSKPLTLMKYLCYYNFLNPKSKPKVIDSENINLNNINPTLLQFLYQFNQNNK